MSSYKDGYGTKGPAGSLAPMDSTLDGSKWHHGVDSVGIAKLTKISAEINDCIDETSKSVAKAQIKVGRLLNDARALIPGDLQFGKWREANTSITNKSTANKLMNLAKQVGEGRITQDMIDALPMSTLKELISAPDSVLSHVRETLKEDEAPAITREAVRELGREAKVETRTKEDGTEETYSPLPELDAMFTKSPVSPAAPKMPASPATPPRTNPAQVVEGILALNLVDRLRRLDPMGKAPYDGCKPEEWAWLVFGLDPFPGYNPSKHVVETLQVSYVDDLDASGQSDADRLGEILNKSFGIIETQY